MIFLCIKPSLGSSEVISSESNIILSGKLWSSYDTAFPPEHLSNVQQVATPWPCLTLQHSRFSFPSPIHSSLPPFPSSYTYPAFSFSGGKNQIVCYPYDSQTLPWQRHIVNLMTNFCGLFHSNPRTCDPDTVLSVLSSENPSSDTTFNSTPEILVPPRSLLSAVSQIHSLGPPVELSLPVCPALSA